MSFAIGLLSLAATSLNPAELGLIDAPGLELQIRKQLKVAQGDALFVRATVDGVPVHGFQIVVRRSAQGERLFVRPSGAPTRFDRLGAGRCRQSRHGKRRAPKRRPYAMTMRRKPGDTAQPTAPGSFATRACCRFISFTKRRPFRCGVMRASSMRSAAPS